MLTSWTKWHLKYPYERGGHPLAQVVRQLAREGVKVRSSTVSRPEERGAKEGSQPTGAAEQFQADRGRRRSYHWLGALPFLALNVSVLAIFLVPVTVTGLALFAVTYVARAFGLTGGYHRYFSHRAFKTSRVMQFVLALLGCMAMQKGPIWWAAHHRNHHRHSDDEQDSHSPVQEGFWWAHVGWILDRSSGEAPMHLVREWLAYPELRFLDRHYWLPGTVLGILCWWLGGASGLVWGFVTSTVFLYHSTFMVNSVCHLFGRRRFPTRDESRNNWLVALLTLGEGWHNNHHYYQSTANQGFYWWEVDITYYILRVLSWFGLVWDLRTPPARVLEEGRKAVATPRDSQMQERQLDQGIRLEEGDEAARPVVLSASDGAGLVPMK
jgi:stearoyl-CoA desaturase (delta-9 desaturase)